MTSAKDLYKILLELRTAAERGDKEEVRSMNINRFTPAYQKVFSESEAKGASSEGFLEHLFDIAKNNYLYTVMPAFPPEERKRYLEKAKTLTSQIEQQISAIPSPS